VSQYRQRLMELVEGALVREETVLASGRRSSFYFDGKLVTLQAEGAYLLARHLLDTLPPDSYDAIGGLTMGADPIAAAVAALSFELGTPKTAFIVRKEHKAHGRMKQIEGPLQSGARVVIVDDVATSGQSILDAVHAVEKEQCQVVAVVALVDRMQGAGELFSSQGYSFLPVFTALELGVDSEEIEAGRAAASSL
jgi:orotate phosphoribosyltransferase